MNKVLVDALAFGKQQLRSKVGAFFIFIFPILLVLRFGAVFSQVEGSPMNLPAQDLDGTPTSRAFLAALNNTTLFQVSMIDPAVDIQDHVRANSLTVALLLPAGFEQDLFASLATNGSFRVNVTLYGDPTRSNFGFAAGVIGAVADQMSFALAGARPILGLQTQSVAGERFTPIDFLLPGIIGMTVMFNSMYTMAAICAEYRSRKYFKLLATTTLRKGEWLAGKIVWFTISMIASLFATLAVGVLAFDVQIRLDPLSLVFIVMGSIMFASFGMLIGSFAKDAESSSALANAIGFPMMFLSGTFWETAAMPDYMQAIAKALPLTYLSDGFRDALIYGNLDRALVNLAVVSVLAVVFFLLGSRVMSWKER